MDSNLEDLLANNCHKSSAYKFFICWVFVIGILITDNCFGLTEKKIHKKIKKFDYIMAVVFDRKKNKYSTISSTNGTKEYSVVNKNSIIFASFTSNKITVNIGTYHEFENEITLSKDNIKSYKHIPEMLNQYFNLLQVKAFELNINILLIPQEYKVYYKSKAKPAKDRINLTFINNINQHLQGKDFSSTFERYTLDLFPHEVFHFVAGYSHFVKMNELREETYASIFGHCVEYSINKDVFPDIDVLNFPDYFFTEPKKDLIKVRKKISKSHVLKSRFGNMISLYYFQAIANNHSGENIHSDKIPKFCHKLFSEHNFKYPIEKPPPAMV